VWLVELAPLADPELVPQAVAAAAGVREEPGQAPTDALYRALRTRRLLLVLDNCEHLLGACAALAAALLGACPGLRVLATSRRPLGLAGEATWWVSPLAWPAGPAGEALPPEALPAPAALLEYGAVRLFVERARDVRPAFALTAANAPDVVRVCACLDGLPLALELAARQAAVLPPAELAARLDARLRLLTGGGPAAHPRQQTLRATLDWSHALLEAAERVLFRRLAVFAGGFDLEAAEAVGADGPAPGGSLPAAGVLEALRRLVDQSLVVADTAPGAPAARYRLLETLREYAAERLVEAGEPEAAVRARHGAYYLALVEAAAPALFGPEQPAWLDRLAGEHDNLRAVLAWSLEGAPGLALRLAGRLWPFWRMRRHFVEGTDWLTRALAGAPAPGKTADWARAALGAGVLARDRGELADARGHLEASLACGRALGEPALVAWALRELGALHLQRGEFGPAEARGAEGLAIARSAGDGRGAAAALLIRAHAAALGGDLGRARALGEESLAAAREAGDPWLLSTVLQRLGIIALDQGDSGAAAPILEEGLALERALGLPTRAAHFEFLLGRLGRLAQARGEPAAAAHLLREAMQLQQTWGERDWVAWGLEALAALTAGPAPARAARLLGAVAAARRAGTASLEPYFRPEVAAAAGAAEAALGAAAYAAARAAGAALSLEEAAAEALREAPPGAP
jgi:predicted ATPase